MFLALFTTEAFAQTEVEREIASLRGITSFYVAVELEAGGQIVRDGLLQVEALNEAIRCRLRDGGFDVLPEARVPPQDRHPLLLIHVNVLDAGTGIYPFSTSLSFHQAVHLARDRSRRTIAATWQEEVLGLTYHNDLGAIPESAMRLLDTFIDDYRRVNEGN